MAHRRKAGDNREKAVCLEGKVLQGEIRQEEAYIVLEETFRRGRLPASNQYEEELQGCKDDIRFQVKEILHEETAAVREEILCQNSGV